MSHQDNKKQILFIFTSASKTLLDNPTGWYLPEAAQPYYTLLPHFHITFASPLGPNPPIDQGSAERYKEEESSAKWLVDPTVKEKLDTALKLSEVNHEDYAAVFYPGGYGPAIDLPTDEANIKICSEFFRAKKPVTAVCHGPCAIVNATDAEGQPIVKGRTVTGISNAEEEIAQKKKDVPFLLEDKLVEKGGNYVKAEKPFDAKVVVDGHLITGQNPASARGVAEELIQLLS
ncbi:hypothetical protein FRC04_001517 [Tulasnella sp. 424]|nr:hypothetical protein FRC04_001517 [Tulasnella sp. 424]KAG8969063.1 hypothetical protein FRC05_001216 [Tulasnella sp. 425]